MLLLTRQNLEKPTRVNKMIINQTLQNNQTVYEFNSRGTSYTVFEEVDGGFQVWSKRDSLQSAFAMPTIRFFNSLKDMAKATKALSGLATLIAA